jgi:TolB protein
VQCRVTASTGKNFLDKTYGEENKKARRLAHKVADEILLAVKNVKGIASTRIVMVGNVGGKKDLYMCDADGGSMVQLTKDGVPCMSPRWSPDGNSIAYLSYRSGFPDVYVMDLNSYQWRRISDFPGLNGGGDFSPDGREVALILSKDGNPELYIMKLRGGRVTRLSQTPRIAEASPSWSPDGDRIVYVSNAARLPQLYVADLSGNLKRLNISGSENVAPDWGPAGIAHCSRREGRYTICVYDPSSGKDTQVTTDMLDNEDPSWAPDGRHIACTRTGGYHSDVYILDTQGDPPVRLTTMQGEWYCPAWSPK